MNYAPCQLCNRFKKCVNGTCFKCVQRTQPPEAYYALRCEYYKQKFPELVTWFDANDDMCSLHPALAEQRDKFASGQHFHPNSLRDAARVKNVLTGPSGALWLQVLRSYKANGSKIDLPTPLVNILQSTIRPKTYVLKEIAKRLKAVK
jgi:hypothetical protein